VWLGVAATCILSLIFSVILSVKLLGEKVQQYADYNAMHAVLQDAPPDTRQIYVLPASGLQAANPKYLRLALGVRAEIVRVADIDWRCDDDAKDVVAFDRSETDGVVSLAVTLPACANFRARFGAGELDGISLTDDHLLRRGDAMSYEMPEGYSIKPNPVWGPTINLGRKMTVRVRPDGRARFIIEHGKPGGIAWFDTP
jgi:hypothetical protein